jgi:hypothetical protein
MTGGSATFHNNDAENSTFEAHKMQVEKLTASHRLYISSRGSDIGAMAPFRAGRTPIHRAATAAFG